MPRMRMMAAGASSSGAGDRHNRLCGGLCRAAIRLHRHPDRVTTGHRAVGLLHISCRRQLDEARRLRLDCAWTALGFAVACPSRFPPAKRTTAAAAATRIVTGRANQRDRTLRSAFDVGRVSTSSTAAAGSVASTGSAADGDNCGVVRMAAISPALSCGDGVTGSVAKASRTAVSDSAATSARASRPEGES